VRKLFGSRPDDDQTQSSVVLESSSLASRDREQPKPNPNTIETVNGNGGQYGFTSEQEKLFAVVDRMRQSPQLESLFDTTVVEVRQVLQSDRAMICRLESAQQALVLAEARGREWTPALGEKLLATCFGFEHSDHFLTQKFAQTDPHGTGNLTPHQLQVLEHYQVSASLALPIMVERSVWGLLVVQQCARPRHWEQAEIQLLYQVTTELTLTVQSLEFRRRLERQAESARTSTQVAARVMDKIRRSTDMEAVFRSTSFELLELLKADRVAIYQFNAAWGGEFISEAVAPGWMPLVDAGIKTVWEDSHLQETQGGRYRNRETLAVDDIYKAGHSPCYIDILEQFQIKAYAIAPIFAGGDLWGLLAAYQNSAPRHWEEVDINCLAQVGAQFGVALKQAEYHQQVAVKTKELRLLAEQERALGKIVDKIRKSLEVETIFKTTTQEVRTVLQADRVVVYRFNPDWTGEFVAESVASNWTPCLGKGFAKDMGDCRSLSSLCPGGFTGEGRDLKLTDAEAARSNQGGFSIADISKLDFPADYLEAMEQVQAKAYLMTAIFVDDRLWGLLAVYQCSGPRQWTIGHEKLISQIGVQFGIALQQAATLEQVKVQAQALEKIAEQERAIAKIVDKIRKSLEVATIFKTTTQEVRNLLQADRVVVYRFNPDWTGEFVAESVASNWAPCLGKGFAKDMGDCRSLMSLNPGGPIGQNRDPKLTDAEQPRSNRGGFSIADISKLDFPPDYLEAMEQIQAKAYLMTAIFVGNQLWGMLAVYQCAGPRAWAASDEKLISQIGLQFGIALQQAAALEQVQRQSEQLAEAANREKTAKERLQQRAIQLLSAVRPTFKGDLTIRAPITEDEIGTIADAYNNTLQSLRKLVIQVKTSATKVAQTSRLSESDIVHLATQTKYQFQELTQTVDQIQEMTDAIKAVTLSAQQVDSAVRQANQIVQAGDATMNRTVDGMLGIRETVAETSKKIKRLSESSQKISRVVNLISNFTTQTQLLALNAAIEATRAGEYGRGFAVVADEVRSLARQSAVATTDIEQLVQEIQTETMEVAKAMEVGIQQVVTGTTLVDETRQSLTAIVAATTEISQLVDGIMQSNQAQTQQSQAVGQTMLDLAVIVTKTSEDAAQITSSFQELLKMAEELQASVGQFKVN
jgi:methyl-accepting chemotaxis protein PixJ